MMSDIRIGYDDLIDLRSKIIVLINDSEPQNAVHISTEIRVIAGQAMEQFVSNELLKEYLFIRVI